MRRFLFCPFLVALEMSLIKSGVPSLTEIRLSILLWTVRKFLFQLFSEDRNKAPALGKNPKLLENNGQNGTV